MHTYYSNSLDQLQIQYLKKLVLAIMVTFKTAEKNAKFKGLVVQKYKSDRPEIFLHLVFIGYYSKPLLSHHHRWALTVFAHGNLYCNTAFELSHSTFMFAINCFPRNKVCYTSYKYIITMEIFLEY